MKLIRLKSFQLAYPLKCLFFSAGLSNIFYLKLLRPLLLFALLAAFLNACATHLPRGAEISGSNESLKAKELWDKFQAKRDSAKGVKAINSKAGVSILQPNGKGARFVVRFFGNLDLPLRMDVSPAVGSPIVFCLEEQNGLMAYYPGRKAAFTHSDAKAGISRLGLVLPFSLKDLAAVLSMTWSGIIQDNYVNQYKGRNSRSFVYTFERPSLLKEVELDLAGKPVRLKSQGNDPWEVELTGWPDDPASTDPPKIITLTTSGGSVITIRPRETMLNNEQTDSSRLAIALPEGTKTFNLQLIDRAEMPSLY